MHRARAVVGRDEAFVDDCAVHGVNRQPLQRARVMHTGQLRTPVTREHRPAIVPVTTQHTRQSRFCENHRARVTIQAAHFDVIESVVQRDAHIGHQCPRRGRPHKNLPLRIPVVQTTRGRIHLLAVGRTVSKLRRVVAQFERDKHARIFDVFVPLRNFVTGQRRAATRAVRQNLVSAIQQSLLVQRG